MYLSRVEIDTNNRKKMSKLNHVGAYHNWVEQSFPEEFDLEERSRKLWRIDPLGAKTYLLVISQERPDLEKLEAHGVKGTGETKDYGSFIDSLEEGMEANFRVSLNPVVAVKEDKGKRGRVKPHVTVDQQRQFLLDRSEKNGFILKEEDFQIVERGYVPFKRKGQRDINLSKVTYEGKLTIRDMEVFRKTLTQGFGKKKAYGFGMLTVIPLG